MPPNPKFDYQHVQKQLSLSGMSSWRGGDKLDIEKVRKHLESENEKASEYVEGLCSLKRSYEKINMESLHCSIASFSHSYLDPMKPNIPNNEENRRKLTRLIDHLNWLKDCYPRGYETISCKEKGVEHENINGIIDKAILVAEHNFGLIKAPSSPGVNRDPFLHKGLVSMICHLVVDASVPITTAYSEINNLINLFMYGKANFTTTRLKQIFSKQAKVLLQILPLSS